MKFAIALLLALLAAPVTLCQEENLLEVLRLLERVSAEGIDVSPYVERLNEALDLYNANRTIEADTLMDQVFSELKELESQLAFFRLQKWLRLGATVAALLAIPPLFYFLFPRAYALVWAFSRRNWIMKEVVRRGSRR